MRIAGLVFRLSVSLLPLQSVAVEEPKSTYELEDLIKTALERSDQIRSAQSRIQEREEAAIQAGVWQNPSFESTLGVRTAPGAVGPQFQVGVVQPFYFPGKQQLRQEVAGFDKNLAEIALADSKLKITADVVRLAYQYEIQERKVAFAESRKKRFELIQAYMAGHLFASPTQKTGGAIVKERLRLIGANEEKLRGELNSRLEQLNFFVDLKAETMPHLVVPWYSGSRKLNDDLSRRAIESNFDLASKKTELAKAIKEKELLHREVWPDFSVSAFYGQETATDTERFAGLGLNISLPIWNRNQAAIRSADRKITALQYEISLKEKQLEAIVRSTLAEYEAARKVVAQYSKETIAKLEAQLKAMDIEFRKSRLDFLLFLELEIQTAETANQILDAQLSLVDHIVALYAITRDQTLINQLSTF